MANVPYFPNVRVPGTATDIGGKIAQDVNIAGGTVMISGTIPVVQGANTAGTNIDGSVGTTATQFVAPANAVGFILMANDDGTASVRWKAGGGVASAASGSQLQPGRDTGFVPCGADLSVASESGTQPINIQWVQSS